MDNIIEFCNGPLCRDRGCDVACSSKHTIDTRSMVQSLKLSETDPILLESKTGDH